MSDLHLRHVGMGEVRIGRRAEVLSALLGSCVAIAVLWPKGQRCGLAHCLLPAAPGSILRPGARYVDQAVPSLMALMGIGADDMTDIQVVVAGGASMLGRAGMSRRVGLENVTTAHTELGKLGLTPVHVDTGGRRGRRLDIDCATYGFTIKYIDNDRDNDRDNERTGESA